LGCPAGYHASRYSCSSLCGTCSFGSNNQSYCEANAGAAFSVCGLGCPAGYYASRYSCSSLCGTCSFGSNNQSFCNRM
jgi:hypothetical protein